ncbi:hypothetical protein HK414_16475 [Ramlibacter terrae]|uniref:Uncharacterized protein n=1 Tax=Ramlibacter terrae TaxID=2732511 RepID=A0ABX6P3Q2_9BURK|nr:hypothetical protein HK414_16475 [Ramlibacter terrae]
MVVTPVNDAPIAPAMPVVTGDAGQTRIDLGLVGWPIRRAAPPTRAASR